MFAREEARGEEGGTAAYALNGIGEVDDLGGGRWNGEEGEGRVYSGVEGSGIASSRVEASLVAG